MLLDKIISFKLAKNWNIDYELWSMSNADAP